MAMSVIWVATIPAEAMHQKNLLPLHHVVQCTQSVLAGNSMTLDWLGVACGDWSCS